MQEREFRQSSGDDGQPLFSRKQRAGDVEDPFEPVYQEYRHRWCIIVSFVLLSSSMGLSVSSLQVIATATKQIYNEDSAIVNLFASSFFLSALIFNFPASYIIRHYSVKCSLSIGAFFTILGAWIRVFINQNFKVAVAGQCLMAVAFSFFFNAPSLISARWFLPRNRGMATIIMSVSFTVFSCIITPLSLIVIDKEPENIHPSQYSHYRDRMQHYQIGLAIYATIASTMGLIFFQEYPPTPVTQTQHVERTQVCESVKRLFLNCSFILAILSFGLAAGSFNGLHILSEQILKKYGMTSRDLANMNLIELPVLILFMIITGYIYRRIGRAKPILNFNMAALLLLIVLIWACLNVKSPLLMTFLLVSQIAFSAPSLGLTIQLSADITFPVSEAVSAGLVFVSDKALSFGLSEGFSPLVDQGKTVTIILVLLVCQGVSFLFILLVQEQSHQNEAYSPVPAHDQDDRKLLI